MSTEFSRTTPRCNAVITTIGLTVEPGSNTSVMVRLRIASFGVPLRLLGLYDGLLAIASTSPVLTSTSTALPDSALLKATALFSSR
ncbi:Uncharacterised protein [Shigella sonnei]|nr:Uncharacterised protein [Shigella sonnei]CSE94877.1 Uncharacterised protein [Shigella sonnei]CSF61405.1 Uncharacterised protein [Shigella sonnei]CSR55391.1 Uncharacterised protein [Shigella sonnei]SRN46115.1 Uncharacterised protein [Shigella flexneri]